MFGGWHLIRAACQSKPIGAPCNAVLLTEQRL
jgi:hypothetical protein